MLGLGEVEHIIKLGVLSAYIKNERAVSLIIVAPVEHGKSELIKRFALIDGIKISTDFNTGIFEDMISDIECGKLKTLMIPDFLRLTKRKQSTAANILGILNALIEEGYVGRLPISRRDITKALTINIITAVTKDELEDKRHRWAKLGFLSRLVPITFSYKNETIDIIREYIADCRYRGDTPIEDMKFPEKPVEVTLPKELAQQIRDINLKLAKEEHILGFRSQKQLQTLAMASALFNNRNIVLEDDIKIIERLSKFINFRFTAV